MKTHEWTPGKWALALASLAVLLAGSSTALAQANDLVARSIANVTVTTDAISEEGQDLVNIVNGSGLNVSNEHSTRADAMWLGRLGNGSAEVGFEFDDVYELHEMWVWNYNVQFEAILRFGVKDVTIHYSVDGANWTEWGDAQFAQATATDDYVANTIIPLGGISARYVKLAIHTSWGPLGQIGLSEVLFLTGPGPTSPSDTYTIRNVVATSNGVSDEETGPENTVNGSGLNANDEHSTAADAMWLTAPGDDPLYIQYEFDDVYDVQEIWVWNYNIMFEKILNFGAKDVTIEYSLNGTDWTPWGDVEFAQATAEDSYVANTIIDLGGVFARYIRLYIWTSWGFLPEVGLSEVRFLTGTQPDSVADAHPIARVTASSNIASREGEGPENTVNGSGLNANYQHSTTYTDMWLVQADPEETLVYIQFEFDDVYDVYEMWVWNYNVIFEPILNFGVKNVIIEYSVNGTDWVAWGGAELAQAPAGANYAANTILDLEGISARYVRLTILDAWGPLGQVGLSEVRFFSGQTTTRQR